MLFRSEFYRFSSNNYQINQISYVRFAADAGEDYRTCDGHWDGITSL
jgi:hypothetical protein